MRVLSLIAVICAAAAASSAQAAELAPGFGKISPIPGAENLPDRNLHYRVIFNVTKAADSPAKVSPSLDKVARFLNLLGSQGIMPRRGDIVVVLHGAATSAVLDDEAFRMRFGVSNPSLALIRVLRKAGVSVHVCGQALAAQKIDRAAVSSLVSTDLSAMTTIATLQLKGWVLIPE